MIIAYFFNGLCFGGLGLAAYLQIRQGGDFALKKQLPWLASFGFVSAVTSWVDMFLSSNSVDEYAQILIFARIILQPISGLLLLIFGWRVLRDLTPLPAWTVFIPGVMIVPISYVIAYAATTFITPSPIEIPIDIWSRYLLYLPGSIMAGGGFLRQWDVQRKLGMFDVAGLMLGTGLAFLFEAFVIGLVVPAAPYGPASYYNYDRVITNAFYGESLTTANSTISWLDYQSVLNATGVPIQFWRMLSAVILTFFMIRGLGVFEAIRRRQLEELQNERDQAQRSAFEAQIAARQTAENWTDVLVSINRRITELEDMDKILLFIVKKARALLQSDFTGLALFDDSYSTLNLKYISTENKNEFIAEPVAIQNELILETVRAARPRRSLETNALTSPEYFDFGLQEGIRAMAIVPLALDNRPVGGIWTARCESKPYSDTDLIWLECMADQVAIAIQHGLMTSHLQSYSIAEERARIAREMHDGLAQVLGYLNIEVQTLGALLKQGRKEALEAELNQMREAVRTANADVRENILSLRTTLANEKGLASAMDEYLQEFSIQTGIETEFRNEVEGELNLASLAEVQLVCILQEALANVRKHAKATLVTVTISRKSVNENESIFVSVKDNGLGFIERNSKRSFGLQTMKERAASVQGVLQIHSIPGEGTTVEYSFPCLSRGKLERNSRSLQEIGLQANATGAVSR